MNTKNLKPFDLEAALNGEPVMLRDGSKAFVRHHETELSTEIAEVLLGYQVDVGMWAWCEGGNSNVDECESEYDIIGMYQKTRIINGFEVPAPEAKAPESSTIYFAPNVLVKELYSGLVWSDYCEWDDRVLSRGLVFLSAEDAIANAKAMLGIDPHNEESE